MPWIQTQVYDGFSEESAQDDRARTDDLTINVWPTVPDCIDWSQDAEIVIGAGDDLQLLIPKLKIVEDSAESMWELLRLRATAFSPQELPQEEPISTRSASLGEEISNSEVVRARWSPPGIAKHGRSALLVLTQNLLLSLWSPGKQPRSHQDWQRRSIINHELQRYFEGLHPELKQIEGQYKQERLKELIRVRAFAISKPFAPGLLRSSSYPLDRFCLISVANDNKQIIILHCQGVEQDRAHPVISAETHFSISDNETRIDLSQNWTFEDCMERSQFVQHIAWSPWIRDADGRYRSMILCATRTNLLFRWALLDTSTGKLGVVAEDFDGAVRLKKPWSSDTLVEWLPEVRQNRYGQLIACTLDKVFLFTIDLLNKEQIKTAKFERSGWAQVAGNLYLKTEEHGILLQTLPHGHNATNFMTTLELPGLKASNSHCHKLSDAIALNRDAFDRKFRTKGNVLTKLWGFTDSPLHDLAVTCATFHPSNSPEYIIPADMTARVIFQSIEREDFITQAVHHGASTEALAFSAKWVLKSAKSPVEKKAITWKFLDQLDKVLGSTAIAEPDPATSSFNDLLFASSALIRMRYERVLSFMMNQSEAALESEKQVIEQIASRVLRIPAYRYRDTHSSRLMVAHLRRILVILKLSADYVHNLQPESCHICSSNIPFNDYSSAQCDNPDQAHRFRRCALTFLAIQAPGICKFCGVCGKQYLTASRVENQNLGDGSNDIDMLDSSDGNSLSPLAEKLSAACDKCIYCGGKFVG